MCWLASLASGWMKMGEQIALVLPGVIMSVSRLCLAKKTTNKMLNLLSMLTRDTESEFSFRTQYPIGGLIAY